MEIDRDLLMRIINLPMLRWDNDEMNPLIELLPPESVVVEVGCFSGESSIQFLQSPRVSKLLCVDRWTGNYDPNDKCGRRNNDDMDAARFVFNLRTQGHPEKLRVHVCESLHAAQNFDGKANMVYIDADHSFKAVAADIRAWLPKIKPLNWLAGHDWNQRGVSEAVRCVLGREPEYIFGDTSWAMRV